MFRFSADTFPLFLFPVTQPFNRENFAWHLLGAKYVRVPGQVYCACVCVTGSVCRGVCMC